MSVPKRTQTLKENSNQPVIKRIICQNLICIAKINRLSGLQKQKQIFMRQACACALHTVLTMLKWLLSAECQCVTNDHFVCWYNNNNDLIRTGRGEGGGGVVCWCRCLLMLLVLSSRCSDFGQTQHRVTKKTEINKQTISGEWSRRAIIYNSIIYAEPWNLLFVCGRRDNIYIWCKIRSEIFIPSQWTLYLCIHHSHTRIVFTRSTPNKVNE